MEDLELFETRSRSQNNRLEWLVGRHDRHPGLVGESLIQTTQQGPSAGQHYAPIHDVGRKLGRGLVQGILDGVDDLLHRLLDRLPDLSRAQDNRLG